MTVEVRTRNWRGLPARRALSLLEVTVAAAVFVGLVLAISLTLITESGRRIRHLGMQAGEPPMARILDRLRSDVWGANSVVMPADYNPYATWYEGPLQLVGHWSGYGLAYAEDEGVLYRIVTRPGEMPEPAPVLHDVARFRWSLQTGTPRVAVLVEVSREETAEFHGPDAVGTPRRAVAERIVIATRQHGGTWW